MSDMSDMSEFLIAVLATLCAIGISFVTKTLRGKWLIKKGVHVLLKSYSNSSLQLIIRSSYPGFVRVNKIEFKHKDYHRSFTLGPKEFSVVTSQGYNEEYVNLEAAQLFEPAEKEKILCQYKEDLASFLEGLRDFKVRINNVKIKVEDKRLPSKKTLPHL